MGTPATANETGEGRTIISVAIAKRHDTRSVPLIIEVLAHVHVARELPLECSLSGPLILAPSAWGERKSNCHTVVGSVSGRLICALRTDIFRVENHNPPVYLSPLEKV